MVLVCLTYSSFAFGFSPLLHRSKVSRMSDQFKRMLAICLTYSSFGLGFFPSIYKSKVLRIFGQFRMMVVVRLTYPEPKFGVFFHAHKSKLLGIPDQFKRVTVVCWPTLASTWVFVYFSPLCIKAQMLGIQRSDFSVQSTLRKIEAQKKKGLYSDWALMNPKSRDITIDRGGSRRYLCYLIYTSRIA